MLNQDNGSVTLAPYVYVRNRKLFSFLEILILHWNILVEYLK